jgi:hypothetical protein
LGGWNNENEESTDKLLSYSFDDNQWSISINENLPNKLSYSATATDRSGNIFLLGGSDHPYRGARVYRECYLHKNQSINFQKSPPENWLQEQDFSTEIDQLFANQLYFHNIYQNEDLNSNNWIEIPSMLTRRCGHGAVTTFNNGNIVAIGGYQGGEGNDADIYYQP